MSELKFLYWPEDNMDPYFDPERRINKHRRETMHSTTLAEVLQFIADCSMQDIDAIESAILDRADADADDSDDDDDDEDDDDGQPSELTENQDFAKDNEFEREQADEVIDKID